jgi:uncharacterized membrane protein
MFPSELLPKAWRSPPCFGRRSVTGPATRVSDLQSEEKEATVSKIEESIDVQVPVRTAYNQWTQFEDFPQFMDGLKEVKQLTDTRLRWRAEIAGVEREWEAEITEQRPDERIAWQSLDGPRHAGVVTFHRLEDGVTRIMLQLEWEPGDAAEKIADWAGFVTQRVKDDLRRFKEFIESRGQETGAWRGEVDQDPTR